jgi:putative ABC transport system permease protein
MSIGAVFAAMNTMYAAVGARTREIGTLRVLGFRRRVILASFNLEGAILAGIGGVLGCALALAAQWFCTIFSVVVGIIGSFLPAVRAARLPVIAALKSV